MQLPGTLGAYVNGYVEGRRLVLFSRTSRGVERTEVPAEWSAFLRQQDLTQEWESKFLRLPRLKGMRREPGGWVRLDFKDPDSRRSIFFDQQRSLFLATNVPHFEADVDPVRRFFTDSGAQVQKPRRVYLDIETDSRVPFSRKEEMRVLSWAIEDEEGNVDCEVLVEDGHGAERDLLGRLWEALAPYDQIAAWYGGGTNKSEGFDFPVIRARSEQRGLGVDYRRWLYVDHRAVFQRMNMHAAKSGEEKRSFKLEAIAQATLGEGKDDFDASKTYEAWAAGGTTLRKMLKYNVKDTALLPRIEKKTGYLGLFATICEVCRIFGNTDALLPTRQMDGFMLRLARERDHHFPSRTYQEEGEDGEEKKQFKGAFVVKPKVLDPEWRARRGMKTGILRDVHVADFSSMYPSIILSWNMSPDTKDAMAPINGPIAPDLCRAPTTGISFRTDRVGLLPLAIAELMRLRKHWNDKKASLTPGTEDWTDADRRQSAYKTQTLSFWGVVGSSYSRYYDYNVAESIAQTGVWLLKCTIAELEKRRHEVVYGDTDGAYVVDATAEQFAAFVKWCNAELYPELLAKQGCKVAKVSVAYEKSFDRIIFIAAKKYAARFLQYKGKLATAESEAEIKGLEYVRGDATRLASQLQKRVIDLLMAGEEGIEPFHRLLSASRRHVLEDALPLEEVVLAKSLSKSLKEYVAKKKLDGTDSAAPAHVVIARRMQALGMDVREGTKIEYVVVDDTASRPEDRFIPATDYTGCCDRHHVWESLVYPPTARLLKAAFPAHDGYWDLWGRTRPPAARKGRRAPEGQEALFAVVPTGMDNRSSIQPPEPPLPNRAA